MKREKVYLVDKDDVIIGSKWRNELSDNDCWRVVSIWITDFNQNILIQQRSLNKKVGPGIWSAACEGTIELNDIPVDTAVRELAEEVGLKIKPEDLVATTKIHYKDPQFGWRIKYGYTLVIDHMDESKFKLQEEEVSQVKWMTKKELDEFHSKSPRKFPLYGQYKTLKFY